MKDRRKPWEQKLFEENGAEAGQENTDQMQAEWIEKARKTAERAEIPESLLPESVTERLMQEGRRPRRGISGYRKILTQVAAVFLVFLILGGGGLWIFRQFGSQEKKNSSRTETKAEMENRSTVLEAPEEGNTLKGTYRTASSYEELYAYLDTCSRWYDDVVLEEEKADGNVPEAIEETVAAAKSENAVPTGEESGETYSRTNTREADVDEADIVKTDGSYLYMIPGGGSGQVHIIRADGGSLRETAVTGKVTDGVYSDYDAAKELYIDGDRMVVLMDCIDEETDESYTAAAVYDITDRGNPILQNVLTQDGAYRSSRKNGNYIYIFSTRYPYPDRKEPRSYIPYVDGEAIPCEDLYYSEEVKSTETMVMTSFDVTKPEDFVDKEAVYHGGETVYVSGNAIYVAEQVWSRASGRSQTELFKMTYRDGKMEQSADKRFLGRLHNEYSIDEYNGYVRLVATVDDYTNGSQANSLYVMDEDLEILGSLHNLAKDERIYSARFMGDTGYFVTFRETDPLFSVDLSDPADPKIMGELKITGFSSYLHPYDKGLLLGIGEEIDPRTGERKGVKLSMFDTGDPYDVKETDKLVIEEMYSTVLEYSHKSVLIDTEKNLFGFGGYTEQKKDGEWQYGCSYKLYSYEKGSGFREMLSVELEDNGEMDLSEIRGVYIGDVLYLVNAEPEVLAYSMKTGKLLDSLEVGED